MSTLKTTFDVAFARGCNMSTVAKAAKHHGIGIKKGRDWIFTEAEADELTKIIKNRGNPNFKKTEP